MTLPDEDSDLGCIFDEGELGAAASHILPLSTQEFSSRDYWRRRYLAEQQQHYDWYSLDFPEFWEVFLDSWRAARTSAASTRGSRKDVLEGSTGGPAPAAALGPACSTRDSKGDGSEASPEVPAPLGAAAGLGPASSRKTGHRGSPVPSPAALGGAPPAGLGGVAWGLFPQGLLVLEIGAGNSEWARRMGEQGLMVLSTDIDHGVLCAQRSLDLESAASLGGHTEEQERAAARRKAVERAAADATALPFRPGTFDVVFDKGTVDALSCSASNTGPSSPAPSGESYSLARTTRKGPGSGTAEEDSTSRPVERPLPELAEESTRAPVEAPAEVPCLRWSDLRSLGCRFCQACTSLSGGAGSLGIAKAGSLRIGNHKAGSLRKTGGRGPGSSQSQAHSASALCVDGRRGREVLKPPRTGQSEVGSVRASDGEDQDPSKGGDTVPSEGALSPPLPCHCDTAAVVVVCDDSCHPEVTPVGKVARSVHRVLAPGGLWVVVSGKCPCDLLKCLGSSSSTGGVRRGQRDCLESSSTGGVRGGQEEPCLGCSADKCPRSKEDGQERGFSRQSLSQKFMVSHAVRREGVTVLTLVKAHCSPQTMLHDSE